MKKTASLLIFIALIATSISAQKGFQTKTVSIFKNGQGFFMKAGAIQPEDNHSFTLEGIPDPLLGTFWISSDESTISKIYSFQDSTSRKKGFPDLATQIMENKGQKVRLLGYEKEQFIEGTIEEASKEFITLKTQNGWRSIRSNWIKDILFFEKPKLYEEQKSTKQVLKMEFESKGKKELNLMYLKNGIGWIPNYLIKIKDDNNAVIKLRSTLINEAEAFEHSTINFVVGVPNFKYASTTSPMASQQGVLYYLQQLYAQGGGMRNNYAVQALSNVQIVADNFDFSGESNRAFSENISTSSQEDLFYYTINDISLQKGQRAQFDIFEQDVPIEHVYTASLTPSQDGQNYHRTTALEKPVKVSHKLKLQNKGETPWTTGTALVTSEQSGSMQVINQDMLKFTPVSGESYLTITESPEIQISESEKEIERKKDHQKIWGDYYNLIVVQGSIKVKNYKSKKAKLEISRIVHGKFLAGKVNADKEELVELSYLNPKNRIRWTLELKPGEEKLIEYSYEFLTRR